MADDGLQMIVADGLQMIVAYTEGMDKTISETRVQTPMRILRNEANQKFLERNGRLPGSMGTGGDKRGAQRSGDSQLQDRYLAHGASKGAGVGSAKGRTLHIGARRACRSRHKSPSSPSGAAPPPASSLRADPPLSWTALANMSRPNHRDAALVLRAPRILCHPGAVCSRNRPWPHPPHSE